MAKISMAKCPRRQRMARMFMYGVRGPKGVGCPPLSPLVVGAGAKKCKSEGAKSTFYDNEGREERHTYTMARGMGGWPIKGQKICMGRMGSMILWDPNRGGDQGDTKKRILSRRGW